MILSFYFINHLAGDRRLGAHAIERKRFAKSTQVLGYIAKWASGSIPTGGILIDGVKLANFTGAQYQERLGPPPRPHLIQTHSAKQLFFS